MTFDPKMHPRRSIRLRGYDYARAGAFFITVVTQGRECLVGQVVAGEMRLNDAGRMIWDEWQALVPRFPAVQLDEFVIMPNHVHGIVRILVGAFLVDAHDGATTRVAPTTLGEIVGAFKSITTNEYIRGVKTMPGCRFLAVYGSATTTNTSSATARR